MSEFDLYNEDSDEDLPKRNPVYCSLVGGLLDLDSDDLGYPQHPGLWQRLLSDKRPVPERGLWCPECYRSRPSDPEWMYVYKKKSGRKIAAHFNKGHRTHNLESPEHLAYKERIARAAELGGFPTWMESASKDRTSITDVRVTGANGTQFGFEPQLTWQSDETARKRDRARRENGITPVWHIVDPKAPLIDQVMWTRSDNLPAEAIRNGRDLLVRGGIRQLKLEKCDLRNPLPCPVKKGGRCGQWHPDWEPLPRQLDDLVRDIASGDFVAMVERAGQRTKRFWTPATDRRLYLENGGIVLPDDGDQQKSEVAAVAEQSRRQAECTKDRRSSFIPTPIPRRDDGASIRPAITLQSPVRLPLPEVSQPTPRRYYSDLTFAEIVAVAREYGCSPIDVGPCGRCYGPTKRYGEHARVLCGTCRPM